MHGCIDIPPDHRRLHLPYEDALASQMLEGDIDPTVAFGLDHHQRRGDAGPFEQTGHAVGLPQRQR
jgi:hypothetical protein